MNVQGLKFKVQGSKFKVQSPGFKVQNRDRGRNSSELGVRGSEYFYSPLEKGGRGDFIAIAQTRVGMLRMPAFFITYSPALQNLP